MIELIIKQKFHRNDKQNKCNNERKVDMQRKKLNKGTKKPRSTRFLILDIKIAFNMLK